MGGKRKVVVKEMGKARGREGGEGKGEKGGREEEGGKGNGKDAREVGSKGKGTWEEGGRKWLMVKNK